MIIEKMHGWKEGGSASVVNQEFHIVRIHSLEVNSREGARATVDLQMYCER